jgi:RNA recognition motif-containing protein
MTNIYVGNLSFQTTQDDLQAVFSRFGNVERVNLVTPTVGHHVVSRSSK